MNWRGEEMNSLTVTAATHWEHGLWREGGKKEGKPLATLLSRNMGHLHIRLKQGWSEIRVAWSPGAVMRFFCQQGKCSLLPEIWWLIIDNGKLRMGFIVLDNTLKAGWWLLLTFLWKGQKVVAVFVFFYFLLLCMYCLFLSFVCFSGLFAMLPKKENNKTKAIFVCGLIFSLSVCPSQNYRFLYLKTQ